ncbi:ankyrin repeat domain-containing protein 1 [Morone saxatilis]|uniref:ankyrin repeat domain-containing protein 1 n=1 Tax=Morone saxatilis TaxID=34816 RepID=UPI0015E1D547|nr:ankyrin repeat domain-containing protein 1 [Morone saxatilis]
MGLHSVEELVSSKRSEGKEPDDFQGGVYEAAVNQEKQDDRRSHRELVGGDRSEESDSGSEQEEVSVAALNTDNSGRLKLETVDDLFNILQLRKRRRERKSPIHKKQQPEPEIVPETVDEQLFLTAAMENKLPVVEKYLSDGGNPNVSDHVSVTQQRLPLRAFKRDTRGGYESSWGLSCIGEQVGGLKIADCGVSFPASIFDDLIIRLKNQLSFLALIGCFCTLCEMLLKETLHSDWKRITCAECLFSPRLKDGDTPMHDAVRINRFKMIKLLMMYGASLNTKNCDGKTPMETLYSWQNGAKSLLFKFSQDKPNQ